MKPTVVHIHVPGNALFEDYSHSYAVSVLAHPAGCDHENLVVCQGREPAAELRSVLEQLPGVRLWVRSGEGLDIGGYIEAAHRAVDQTNPMVCMGGHASVRKAGWLTRMMEAWDKHGPGFYGSLSSYQGRPHFNTTGFWCLPEMLTSYPHPVVTKGDCYEFEHGPGACWRRLHDAGVTTKLVTWCGEYDWPEWRTPENISCRGDQSNCLTYFRVNYDYDAARVNNPGLKAALEGLTDRLGDPEFSHLQAELKKRK